MQTAIYPPPAPGATPAAPAQKPFVIDSPADRVNVGQPQLDSFQGYQDAAYQQAMRTLQPNLDSQNRKFEQQMINKGLTPGSKAFELAQAQMQRGQNDLQGQAAFGAMGFGQQAQNQAFQQGLSASQLKQTDMQRLQQNRQFQQNFGLEQDRFGLQQQQADFGNLMNIGNFAMGYGGFQNTGLTNEYNMGQTTLAGAPGFMGQQVNVNGAYNTAVNAAQGAAQMQMDADQATMQGIGQLAGAAAMLSGSAYKKIYGKTDPKHRSQIAANILSMPVYDWDYLPEYREKGDEIRHGPLAEDFNNMIVGKEADTIDIQRYVASLHVTVQEMFREIRRLEVMLFHAVNQSGIMHDSGQANKSTDPETNLNDVYESVIAKAVKNHKEYHHA